MQLIKLRSLDESMIFNFITFDSLHRNVAELVSNAVQNNVGSSQNRLRSAFASWYIDEIETKQDVVKLTPISTIITNPMKEKIVKMCKTIRDHDLSVTDKKYVTTFFPSVAATLENPEIDSFESVLNCFRDAIFITVINKT